MEEIKVNDYIRTVDGIKKVIAINTGTRVTIYGKYVLDKDYKGIRPVIAEKNIFKHSENIIDLIEVGDYVNGHRVIYVCNEEPCPSGKYVDIDCDKPSEYCTLWETEIKSIVTHEQFEAMKYKVEE